MNGKAKTPTKTSVTVKPTGKYGSIRLCHPEVWMLTAVFAIAGLVLVFGHIAEEVLEGDATKFDQTILLFFRNANDLSDPIGPPWVEEMARDITALGSYAVLSIIFCAVVAYLVMTQQRAAAFWVLAAIGGGVLLSNVLKLVYERPRPDLVPHAARVFTTSFPSGHATLSAITYLTLGALLASLHDSMRFKIYFLSLASLLTIAVGISCIYLGVHYPTDVLAGWCIGAAWAAFCWSMAVSRQLAANRFITADFERSGLPRSARPLLPFERDLRMSWLLACYRPRRSRVYLMSDGGSRDRLKAMQVGFIGLGSMGSGMAANLLKAGHALTVYNRTPAKAEALVAEGATLAKTPREAARGDVVITMLADDAAVEDVVFGADGILAGLKSLSIHVSMSTISVALAERLASAHQAAGQRFVAAPVFGRPEAAAAGKLFIVAAGEPKTVQACQPLFEALGQRTFVIADEPPKANLVKLSGNFLIAAVIENLGEAFALVGKAGIDRAGYLDILTNTLFGAPVYKTYGGIISEERYAPPGFTARLGFKDIHLALAAAEALQVPMPVASLLRDRFLTLLATGAGDLDWSALAALASRDAGEPSSLFAAK